MKKIIAIILFLFTITAFASTNEQGASVLLVMLSKHAVLQKTKQPDLYKLTLTGVNPKTVYFTDRPNRISGQMMTEKLMKNWNTKRLFEKDAPNAVMEAVRVNNKTKALSQSENSYAITLYNPTLSKAHPNQMTFDVKLLPGTKDALPLLSSNDYVALFIDRACLSCIG